MSLRRRYSSLSKVNPLVHTHRVVIIGCGFGGLFAARALKRAPVSVTVLDRRNHHLFQPLLYQVATGILSEGQIAPPIRDVFRKDRNTRVVLAEVQRIDLETSEVHVDEFGRPMAIPFDSLIVACGAETSFFGHEEFSAHVCTMKSLDDALTLRDRIFGAFELAEAAVDDAERRRLVTFVIVGGGPTGVEMAGQLRELARRALRNNYRRIDPRNARVVLVEGVDHLVRSMGSHLSARVERDLRQMGVEVHLEAMVTDIDERGVVITKSNNTTQRIEAATKVWAAGMHGGAIGADLTAGAGAQLHRSGRVGVAPDCSLPGHPEVFVVGDLMALGDLPGVAEVAIQSGVHAARTTRRRLEGKSSRPFRYRDLGTLAAVSRFSAVAKIGFVEVGGFIGWLLWLTVHLAFLTGFKNRFGALARWAISFVGRGRYERALTGQWTAGIGGDLGPSVAEYGSGLDEQAMDHDDAVGHCPSFRSEGLGAISATRTERTDNITPGVEEWTYRNCQWFK
jgi:NADH:ubiquinone reductase (H+-translocating)